MEAFVVYLFKSGLCLGVFIIIYALLLRSTTFYKLNRFFLLSGFVLSLIIPFINYSYDVLVPLSAISVDSIVDINYTATTGSAIDVWFILFELYCLGTFILLIRNFLSYKRLSFFIKNGVKSDNGNYKLVDNKDIVSPFTVLNYILLNSQSLSKAEKELILKHELIHIRQKHWLDLLFSECILVLQWFNPLAWFYVYFLKENHEFLADKAVIDSGVSPALYQAVLINQQFHAPVFSFSNSFNHPKLFSRLSMLKKAKSSPWKSLNALFVFPILVLFVWSFAKPNYVTSVKNPFFSEQLFMNKQFENEDLSMDKSEVFIVSRDVKSKMKSEKMKAETAKQGVPPLYIVDGERVSHIDDLNSEYIESMSVLKDKASIQLYGKGAENGVVVITTKRKLGLSVSGVQKDDKSLIAKESDSEKERRVVATHSDNRELKDILFVVDGEIESAEKVKSIDTDMIESVEVLKDKAAVDMYGELGRNGVVKVATKKI